uniref:Putative ovule protein n=1 Tax=Solanum chacoense TaxID=4108 RepID=A0A0V0GSZ0_SOLCH
MLPHCSNNYKKLPRHMVPIFWHKPPEGNFKLNIDGSFESQTTNGGTGGVIRNQLGTWIVGFACKIKARNALHDKSLRHCYMD